MSSARHEKWQVGREIRVPGKCLPRKWLGKWAHFRQSNLRTRVGVSCFSRVPTLLCPPPPPIYLASRRIAFVFRWSAWKKKFSSNPIFDTAHKVKRSLWKPFRRFKGDQIGRWKGRARTSWRSIFDERLVGKCPARNAARRRERCVYHCWRCAGIFRSFVCLSVKPRLAEVVLRELYTTRKKGGGESWAEYISGRSGERKEERLPSRKKCTEDVGDKKAFSPTVS